ncbi:phage tail spike protein, partial [uncultured Clostridium sp.]|uniref:phage tail spike protein n=1 Tax=uncultured Clostridium sp. TaxID=59620 RepID=UPI00267185F6
MRPSLYNQTGEVKLGDLNDCINGIVIEERNGMFEAEITYAIFSPLWDSVLRGNIIVAHANDTLKFQKFRIYKTSKPIKGVFKAFAKHISYDLLRDIIEGLDIENQSCQYCLNQIFRLSQFSQHFKGYSDIINAQNFKIGTSKVLNAIVGKEGSVLDTFGTGAELLRDNENVHILNARGHDNGVTIEYGKNLTGIDLTDDDSNMVTRIKAIAKYNDTNGDEVIVNSEPKYIDSPKVLDYETPFIEEIDFSDKFGENETPTPSKLRTLAEKYFRDTKCDFPKTNAKISFIPLSKCVGYEGIEDAISLCDIVTIKDYRYNYETKAKVIKTTYNFLTERYESMEVGEPRSKLGDVIGGNGQDGKPGRPGPPGPPGADGNIENFPDTLPSTPILSSKLHGFASIELNWTFENLVYYSYELYASKTKDFTPNVFDIIHQGQSSSFLFAAKPNETWYFRVCCVNSHGKRTAFSNQIAVTTVKIDDLSNYVDNAAIGEALIGTLSLDRGWFGVLKGNYIDARQLSVTDGNDKRTLDIDSFGNVNLDVASLKIKGNGVATQTYVSEENKKLQTQITANAEGIKEKVNASYVSQEITKSAEATEFKFSNNGDNILVNGRPKINTNYWYMSNSENNANDKQITLFEGGENWTNETFKSGIWWKGTKANDAGWCCLFNESLNNFKFNTAKKYSISLIIYNGQGDKNVNFSIIDTTGSNSVVGFDTTLKLGYQYITFDFIPAQQGNKPCFGIYLNTPGFFNFYIPWVVVKEGEITRSWISNGNEIGEGKTLINRDGVTIFGALTVKNNKAQDVFVAD